MLITKNNLIALTATVFALLAFLLIAPTKRASAQETNNEPKPTSSYEYVANKGDNLTYLVRKSVQLYSQAKDIDLSQASKLYCETNIVQKMGARHIDITERISVPFTLLQEYISQGRELSKDKQAAWQKYVANVDFELNNVNPVNLETAQDAATPRTSSTDTDENGDQTEDNKDQKDSRTSPSWIEWVAVLGASAVVGYYFTKFKP